MIFRVKQVLGIFSKILGLGHSPHSSRDWIGLSSGVIKVKDGCTLSAQLPSPHGNLSGGFLHFLFSQMFV